MHPVDISMHLAPSFRHLPLLQVPSPTWGLLPRLLQIPPMLLDDFRFCLANLTLLERIRVPRLETVFLGGSGVAYTFGAMRL
jgi:hypothetical protein